MNVKMDVPVKMMMKTFLEIPRRRREEDPLVNLPIVLIIRMMDFHHGLEFQKKSEKEVMKD